MTELPLTTNPFAFMMDPEAVLRAVEQSQQRTPILHRRVCRPLDKGHGAQTNETPDSDRHGDEIADRD